MFQSKKLEFGIKKYLPENKNPGGAVMKAGNAKHEWIGKESSYISEVSGCWLEKETDWKSWRTARRQKDHNCERGKLELGITGRSRKADLTESGILPSHN